MPQMAPLNWLTLFIMFYIYLMLFSSLNYFFFAKTSIKILIKKSSKKMNWLW
nr:ATP synthase F0 subunit 8 [Cryptocephalus flavolimbatus]